MVKPKDIRRFGLKPGRLLGSNYAITEFLGRGLEGEVYKVVERHTGIERAAKLYFPKYNPQGRTLRRYSQKLNKLKDVPVIIQYHHRGTTRIRGQVFEFMVSEYVDGELLSQLQMRQPGKRFSPFEALHIVHALAAGIAPIHSAGEYHGDQHTDNIIIRRKGIGYKIKILDFFDLGRSSRKKISDDVIDLTNILFELVGGPIWYRKAGTEIKQLVCGRKHSLIRTRFRTAGELHTAIENLDWS